MSWIFFTDNGVKYVEIPENISRELQETVCNKSNESGTSDVKRERLLYDSYIQGISCDDYSVNRIVLPAVVLKHSELIKYTDKKTKNKEGLHHERSACQVYKTTYRLFKDLGKYLKRNTISFDDYAETYIGLCYNTLTAVIAKLFVSDPSEQENKPKDAQKEKGKLLIFYGVFAAVFRNILEIMICIHSTDHIPEFCTEMRKMLTRVAGHDSTTLLIGDREEAVRMKAVVWLMILYQIEYALCPLNRQKAVPEKFYDSIQVIVKFILQEAIYAVMIFRKEKSKASIVMDDRVRELFDEAKQFFFQLSCGLFDSDYEKNTNQNSILTTKSAEAILFDMNAYLGIVPHRDRAYIKSTAFFIYEIIKRGE